MVINAPKPARKKKATIYDCSINIRLDSYQLAKLKEIAERRGVPYQKLMRKVLDDFIKEYYVY